MIDWSKFVQNNFHGHHKQDHKDELAAAVPKDHHKEMKHMPWYIIHLECLAKTGAILTGDYALHEKHKAKKEPENAHKHKLREEVAATIAVGATGFALHEYHKVKEHKKELKKEKRHAHHHHHH